MTVFRHRERLHVMMIRFSTGVRRQLYCLDSLNMVILPGEYQSRTDVLLYHAKQ